MEPIVRYLRDKRLLTDKIETRRSSIRLHNIVLYIDDILYRRTFTLLYIKCWGNDQVEYVITLIFSILTMNNLK